MSISQPSPPPSTQTRSAVPLGAKLCYLVAFLCLAGVLLDLVLTGEFDSRPLAGGIFLALGIGVHLRKDRQVDA